MTCYGSRGSPSCRQPHARLADPVIARTLTAQAAKSELAVELGKLCEQAGMEEVLALPRARVPVVKFLVPATKTKVGALCLHKGAIALTASAGGHCHGVPVVCLQDGSFCCIEAAA